MKKITKFIFLFSLLLSLISFTENKVLKCTATWYDTKKHPKIHREYSTAAFNVYPRETKLLVTNILNGKSDTVIVTDRHNSHISHIDLSKNSFSKLASIKKGKINVTVKKIN